MRLLEKAALTTSGTSSSRRLRALGSTLVLALLCAPMVPAAAPPDTAAVKAVTESWAATFATGDLKAISQLYTDDARLLPPGEAQVAGRIAILAWFEKNLRPAMPARIRFHNYEIYGGGVTATSMSEFEMNDGKGRIVERGKQMIVLVKQRGRWKIHRDMWSDNTSATTEQGGDGRPPKPDLPQALPDRKPGSNGKSAR